MKAAIGNSLLLGIILTFVTTVLLILVSSIVYTKSFRIKNRIVDVIEKYEVYDVENVQPEIEQLLREIGYKANSYSDNSSCNRYGDDASLVNPSSAYYYCVFKIETEKSRGYYYKVVTFAYLDLPLVNAIQVPVYGETKIFYPQESDI